MREAHTAPPSGAREAEASRLKELAAGFVAERVGGILVVDEDDRTLLYADEGVRRLYGGAVPGRSCGEVFPWFTGCPRLSGTGPALEWDAFDARSGRTFIVRSGLVGEEGRRCSVHQLLDVSAYVGLSSDLIDFMETYKDESEHDKMTGLYNKGKFMKMEPFYRGRSSLGVINLDVNDLKESNDKKGHDAGDLLLKKAADSIRKVCGPHIHGYRMGGDEFMMMACDLSRDEVDALMSGWERELARLNSLDDGVKCVIAAGAAYGENGFDLIQLLREADERMYEDKKAKKNGRPIR